jgi:hypothetical protein
MGSVSFRAIGPSDSRERQFPYGLDQLNPDLQDLNARSRVYAFPPKLSFRQT